MKLNLTLIANLLFISFFIDAQDCSETILPSSSLLNYGTKLEIIDNSRCLVYSHTKVFIYTKIASVWTATDSIVLTSGFFRDMSADTDIIALSDNIENVYIYEWDGTNWNNTSTITDPFNEVAHFGASVSIHNNRLAIGGYTLLSTLTSKGKIYIYDWDGSTWVLTEIPESEDKFTGPLELNGDRVAISKDDTVYVYSYDGVNWNENVLSTGIKNRCSSCIAGFSNTNFGKSFAIDGNKILIGAESEIYQIDGQFSSSAAYLYTFINNDWKMQKFTALDFGLPVLTNFGKAVDIKGDKFIISNTADYVFAFRECVDGYSYEIEEYRDTSLTQSVSFGKTTALHPDYFLASTNRSPFASDECYVFECNNATPVNCSTFTPFLTTWQTDNPGVSNNKSITIETTGSGYYYDIDWENDGIWDDFNIEGDITHEYATAGTYQVAIRGSLPRLDYSGNGDKLKLLSIDQWGDIQWLSFANAFQGCENLVLTTTASPRLSNCKDLSNMFNGCSSLNTNIRNWDTFRVENMEGMLKDALAFDHYLTDLNIVSVTNMTDMLSGTGMTTQNYDMTLIDWADQFNDIQDDVTFGADGLTYCNSTWWRNKLINNRNWTITGDSQCGNLPFITSWKTNVAGVADTLSISIDTRSGYTYNYDVDWDNDGIYDDLGVTGDISHTYNTAGCYTIAIRGVFPTIEVSGDNRLKLQSIDQWGSIVWETMDLSFFFCSNLVINAIDAPDLSGSNVFGCTRAFQGCVSLTGGFDDWDVSNVDAMDYMFNGCTNFNSDLSAWDVSDLDFANYMFNSCSNFNSDLSSWNVSNITNASNMFSGCTSFNSDISGWNVSSMTNVSSMFSSCTSLDVDLGSWDIDQVTNFSGMLSFCGMSYQNYDNTLIGWSGQSVQANMSPGVSGLRYCNAGAERDILINTHNWTIIGDFSGCYNGPGPDFITEWRNNSNFPNPTMITIPTFPGETYNYDIDWENDGVWDEFGLTGDATHDYGNTGIYHIRIRGTFPRIHVNNNIDIAQRLRKIENWGDIEWSSMENAFYGAQFMELTAIDTPDLSAVTSVKNMFNFCFGGFEGDLSFWDVSNISDFSFMFSTCSQFESDLSQWDVSSATNLSGMFAGCSSFNSDLSQWNTSQVTDMSSMFSNCDALDTDLSQWNTSSVIDMSAMFTGFDGADPSIGSWDVSNVSDFSSMFENASSMNWDISSWNVGSGSNFFKCFYNASSFNQDLSDWTTSSIDNADWMFLNATSFDADIGNWDINTLTTAAFMLQNCNMSKMNYDSTLIKWAAQAPTIAVSLGAGGLEYCFGETARNSLVNSSGWTISGDVKDCVCTTGPTASCQNIIFPIGPTGMRTLDPSNVNNGSTDDCAITSYSLSEDTFDCNSIGIQLVLLTVTDNDNNTDSCLSEVEIVDFKNPTASCKDITLCLDENNQANISFEDIDNGSSDNCGISNIVVTPSDIDQSDIGIVIATMTLIDFSGNIAQCTSQVDVYDFNNCPLCPSDYTLSGVQDTSFDYETDGEISSIQQINSGVTVDYDSGVSILLTPGFETVLGALFEAFIDGCGGNR